MSGLIWNIKLNHNEVVLASDTRNGWQGERVCNCGCKTQANEMCGNRRYLGTTIITGKKAIGVKQEPLAFFCGQWGYGPVVMR